MTPPLHGRFVNGIWWSWEFLNRQLQFESQLGQEADDILATIMGAVIAQKPDGHGDDYVVVLELGQLYYEARNWTPPDVLAVPVRLQYIPDLKRHEWCAKTLMFTRKAQCDINRVRRGARAPGEHFRADVVRRVYNASV